MAPPALRAVSPCALRHRRDRANVEARRQAAACPRLAQKTAELKARLEVEERVQRDANARENPDPKGGGVSEHAGAQGGGWVS